MNSLAKIDGSTSPFDAIRQVDDNGEFWSARDLMTLLGYPRWSDFKDVIEKAKASCENTGNVVTEHFSGLFLKNPSSKQGRNYQDFKLSRYASYLVAMNGDPRKPEIASAQSYFAIKTREAEVVIPAQNDHIRELELRLQLAQAETQKALAEKAVLDARHLIVATCPEPVQQKILGYSVVEKVEYRDRIIHGQDLINDGSTINKTALCRRYGFVSKSGKPDYIKLNRHLDSLNIPDYAWENVSSIRENQELRRDYLEELDKKIIDDSRQLWFGE
jgi:hypothetical protein